MNLIQSFAALLAQGVTVNLKLTASGPDKIQLDFVPVAKENKAGIALPVKALIGTAQELDEHLPAFLAKYVATVTSVASIATSADAELAAAEREASELAKKALEAKRGSKPSKTASTPAAVKRRDTGAGLIDDEDEDEGTTGSGGSQDSDEDALPSTTLNTNTAAPAAAAAAPAAAAPHADLLTMF